MQVLGMKRCLSARRRWFSSIPVIDVQGYVQHGEVGSIVQEISDACRQIGFFRVAGLPVDPCVKRKAYEQLRGWFEGPQEEKMKIHIADTRGIRGYIGLYEQGGYGVDDTDKRKGLQEEETETRDYKEVFTMGTELPETYPFYADDLFAVNVWPPNNEEFRTAVQLYYDQTMESSKIMYSLFARCLEQPPDFFEPLITHPMNSMNCIYYPMSPHGNEKMSTGIGSHTDYECFTLLSQDDVPGLEILDDNFQWHIVPADPDVFVVNIGDMLARWSNNEMRSTVHRACNPTGRPRQSIAFFCAPNYDATIRCLCPSASPLYPPITAGDHLAERIRVANAN